MITIDDLPDVVTVDNHWRYFYPASVEVFLDGVKQMYCTDFSVKGGWLTRYVGSDGSVSDEKETVYGEITFNGLREERDFLEDHWQLVVPEQTDE